LSKIIFSPQRHGVHRDESVLAEITELTERGSFLFVPGRNKQKAFWHIKEEKIPLCDRCVSVVNLVLKSVPINQKA
jgi:hypothetical protein